MAETFSLPELKFHRNGHNLHISLHREPDAHTLKSVSSLLTRYADPGARLFLDVRDLNSMPQQTVSSLQTILKESPMQAQSIYFKGPLGFTLASDGNRVLIVRSREDCKKVLPSEAAQRRFVKRGHKCKCGGRCGDKCCQVTGGPCCGGKGHHHHEEETQEAVA